MSDSPEERLDIIRGSVDRLAAVVDLVDVLHLSAPGKREHPCWCELGLGHPGVKEHRLHCAALRAALAKVEEVFEYHPGGER